MTQIMLFKITSIQKICCKFEIFAKFSNNPNISMNFLFNDQAKGSNITSIIHEMKYFDKSYTYICLFLLSNIFYIFI